MCRTTAAEPPLLDSWYQCEDALFEIEQAFGLNGTYPELYERFKRDADWYRELALHAPDSVLLELMAATKDGTYLVPLAGFVALYARSPERAREHAIGLILSARSMGVFHVRMAALYQVAENDLSKDDVVRDIVDWMESNPDRTEVGHIVPLANRLELDVAIDSWVNNPNREPVSATSEAAMLVIAAGYREESNLERTDRMRQILDGIALVPGRPRMSFAMMADDSHPNLEPALRWVLQSVSATRAEDYPPQRVLSLAIMWRSRFIWRNIDLGALDLSEEARAFIDHCLELGDQMRGEE